MKKNVRRSSEETILTTHPMRSRIEGWFFRLTEVSEGHFVVDGTDLWGRTISTNGWDVDTMIAECEQWIMANSFDGKPA